MRSRSRWPAEKGRRAQRPPGAQPPATKATRPATMLPARTIAWQTVASLTWSYGGRMGKRSRPALELRKKMRPARATAQGAGEPAHSTAGGGAVVGGPASASMPQTARGFGAPGRDWVVLPCGGSGGGAASAADRCRRREHRHSLPRRARWLSASGFPPADPRTPATDQRAAPVRRRAARRARRRGALLLAGPPRHVPLPEVHVAAA